MATLAKVLGRLADWEEELTIYAEEPWTPDSRAVVAAEPADGSLPNEARGLVYFLEVSLAREIVAGVEPQRTVDSVIFYARNDAYPPCDN